MQTSGGRSLHAGTACFDVRFLLPYDPFLFIQLNRTSSIHILCYFAALRAIFHRLRRFCRRCTSGSSFYKIIPHFAKNANIFKVFSSVWIWTAPLLSIHPQADGKSGGYGKVMVRMHFPLLETALDQGLRVAAKIAGIFLCSDPGQRFIFCKSLKKDRAFIRKPDLFLGFISAFSLTGAGIFRGSRKGVPSTSHLAWAEASAACFFCFLSR